MSTPSSSSCNLVWLSGANLNFKTVDGFRTYSYKRGPYEEGQLLNLQLVARYRRPSLRYPSRFISCGNVKYEIDLPPRQRQFLSLDENKGVIRGRITDIDDFLGIFPEGQDFKEEDYFPIARAPNPRRVFFGAKAYLASNPNVFITRNFFFDVAISWDSKRKALLIGPRKLNQDFSVNGVPATNEQYWAYLRSQKFF